MKRVLIATDVPFWRRQKGNQQRIAALVDYLASRFDLTVAWFGREPPAAPPGLRLVRIARRRGLAALPGAVFAALPAAAQQRAVRLLNALHFRRPLHAFRDEAVLAGFAAVLQAGRYDAVIIEYVWHAYLAGAVDRARSLLLLDTHDIFHRRVDDYARFGRTPDRTVTREQELAAYGQFDHLIAIQPVELACLESSFPGRAVLAMHPATARPGWYRRRLDTRRPDEPLVVVYMASFGDLNVDAIEWFVREVWQPRLAEGFRLEVHGAICDSLHLAAPGVTVCGRCDDIDEVYRRADIAINPVRFGSGLKVKTVEALGYGIPVLTTTVGAEGLEAGRDRAYLCADDADGLRLQLTRLADAGLRARLSDSALEFVAQTLTPAACFEPLCELIDADPRGRPA